MCADKTFDAVIVGSGISGALIAKTLGLANKEVLILEAGEKLPPDINGYMDAFLTTTFKVPESPYPPKLFTGRRLTDPATMKAGRPTVLSLNPKGSSFGAWQDPTQSYLVQKGPLPFASTYERINAGTSRHWLGTSLRFVPADFEMKSRYGQFVDWPVKYDAIEPWYCDAEKQIGVSADAEDQKYLGITFSSPYPMPRIPLSRVDMAVSDAMADLKIPGVGLDDLKWEVSSTPAARNSQPYQDRRVCAGNTNCIPICPIQAKYDPSVTLAEASRTGHVTMRYQCVASKVNVGADGQVTGIDYIDYSNGAIRRATARAKIYVLAGNAIETPRLLLMSKSGSTPNGVANRRDGKGVIGKNLMDHPLYLAWALAPKPVWGYRGPLATAGIEVCRDGDFRRDRGAFRIEIGNEGWNFAAQDPDTTTIDLVNGSNTGGLNKEGSTLFGPALRTALNDKLTRQFRLGFLIEQSPDDSNTVTLASNAKDGLGLPRPQITYNLSDYTKLGMAAAQKTATAIFNKMGAQEFTRAASEDNPSTFLLPNSNVRLEYFGAGHLVGTHRMGTSAADSAVDDMQRSWDHKNLFLVGSGSFPTVATANPTLTLAALCLRTADFIVKKVLT
jgi:choline dehydrogenase-like flavoprotein